MKINSGATILMALLLILLAAAELIHDSITGQTYQRTLTEIHTFKEKEDGGVEENISRSVQMTPL